MSGAEVCTELRVRYAETDQMGIVYYGHFFTWFEVSRVEWLRAHGIAYRDLEKQGCMLPVRSTRCTYHRPARYDDRIRLRTRVIHTTTSRMTFSTIVENADTGEQLAEGETQLVCMDPATWRVIRMPEPIRRMLTAGDK